MAFDFDERDEGVKTMIRQTIEGVRRHGTARGHLRTGPLDYPEMAAQLVQLGIDAMSVSPDVLLKITGDVLAERSAWGVRPGRYLTTEWSTRRKPAADRRADDAKLT
ncbi:hypothetical protein WKW80_32695 [Variovorax humicola]|uniref:PEP-utilising enzyme C-terminal domain-containing protein n=1 Tax=Variovorax humicola TaxID=1769758 RepID=A0ABU8W9K3_9BURK